MSHSKTVRLQSAFPILTAAVAFFMLLAAPAEAAAAAKSGLLLCARSIVPTLFPFFVLSSLMLEVGLPYRLAGLTAPLTSRIFRVSGEGATAFLLGLCGGYPLGATATAELHRNGTIPKEEAQRLLAFCNNCGPAFIVGAAGVGVFRSTFIGLLLYLVQILSSILVGILFSIGAPPAPNRPQQTNIQAVPLAPALSNAIRTGVTGVLNVCGFVVFFSVLCGMLSSAGILGTLVRLLSTCTGLELSACTGLLQGFLELGGGIGALYGVSRTPQNLAVCAFVLGWGGVCVHCQTAAAILGSGLSAKNHTIGRLLHGCISMFLALLFGILFL